MKLAVTGHRPNRLGGYGERVTSDLYAVAFAALRQIKPTRVLTGMALGWDMAIAAAANDQNIPFDAYVPFAGQESRWPAESQERYHTLLSYARQVIICSEGGYAGWKMMYRNKRMVRAADGVLALYDGQGQGGTAQAVAYAKDLGKRVVNVWDEYQQWARS